jgi:hypothetical protein
MATEPVLAAFQLTALQCRDSVRSPAPSDYWETTKPSRRVIVPPPT